MPRAKQPELTYVPSLEELGKKIGRTLRGVTRLRGLGAPVKEVRGKGFAVEPVQEWMRAHAIGTSGWNLPRARTKNPPKAKGAPAAEDEPTVVQTDFDDLLKVKTNLATAQASEREAKAALAQLLLKERLGQVVPKEEAKRRSLAQIEAIRSRMLRLPRDCAPKIEMRPRGECEQILSKEVRVALESLAQA